jgi:hypothetical protein
LILSRPSPSRSRAATFHSDASSTSRVASHPFPPPPKSPLTTPTRFRHLGTPATSSPTLLLQARPVQLDRLPPGAPPPTSSPVRALPLHIFLNCGPVFASVRVGFACPRLRVPSLPVPLQPLFASCSASSPHRIPSRRWICQARSSSPHSWPPACLSSLLPAPNTT